MPSARPLSRRSSIRRAAAERGQALVEMALVLPILLLLLLGMLEFGRAMNYWNDTNQLAGEGARYAAVNRNPGGTPLKDWLIARAMPELKDGSARVGQVQVCIDFPEGTSQVGDPVHVHVESSMSLLPLVGDEVGIDDLTIAGDATMRLEQVPSDIVAGCS